MREIAYACVLRVSMSSCTATPGRLAVGPEPGVPAVLRRAAAVTLEVAEATKDGGDAGGEDRAGKTKRRSEYGFFYGPPANRKRRLVAIDDSRLSIRPIAIRTNPDLACMMRSHASVPISGAA